MSPPPTINLYIRKIGQWAKDFLLRIDPRDHDFSLLYLRGLWKNHWVRVIVDRIDRDIDVDFIVFLLLLNSLLLCSILFSSLFVLF